MKQHIITAAVIFTCHNNYFLVNDAQPFKNLAFNVALFDVALFGVVHCLMLRYFRIVLFDVPLFSCRTILTL